MIKLDFEYDYDAHEQRAYHKGFTVRAVQDGDAENPWKLWDYQTPLAVKEGRTTRVYSGAFGDPLEPFSHYTDGQINRHWPALRELLDIGDDLDRDLRAESKQQGESLADTRLDYLRNSGVEDFNTLAEIWGLIGVPALAGAVGNYGTDCLLVYTPAVAKARGHTTRGGGKSHAQLESEFKLYEAWAVGDVYGYVIEDSDGDELGSCWGFYGDIEESGLVEEATVSLSYLIRERFKIRANRVKQLIKAGAPFESRQTVLRGYPIHE